MISRYAVAALAVAGGAAAQANCNSNKITIQNSGDAKSLSSCQTIKGDITIDPKTSGDIAIDGVSQIMGDLTCDGCANVTSLSGDSLSRIGGAFLLNGLTSVGSLNFPSLTEVGRLHWNALGPGLGELSFGQRGVIKADALNIENTFLTKLDGINLEQVDEFSLANNNFLSKVEVQLYNITKGLSLSANGMNLSAEFPNLEWAYNLTFRNVSQVKLPSLARVNGSLGFFDGFYEEISCPNLTRLDSGSLIFADNNDLTNISFPQVNYIGGGLTVANNTHLSKFGFSKVQTVKGAVDLSGNFTDADLSGLKVVQGGFNAQTSKKLDCSSYQNQKKKGIIRGKYTCKGNEDKPQRAGKNSGGSSTSSGATPSKTGAAGHVAVDSVSLFGSSSILSALLYLMF